MDSSQIVSGLSKGDWWMLNLKPIFRLFKRMGLLFSFLGIFHLTFPFFTIKVYLDIKFFAIDLLTSMRLKKTNINTKININIFYFFCLIIIFILSLIIRLSLIHLPIYNPDAYLNSASNFLATGEIESFSGRSFPYPIFILITLFLSKSFQVITVIQHIINWIGGIFLLLFINEIEKMLFTGSRSKQKILIFIYRLFSYLILILFLFNIRNIYREHTFMRESIIQLFYGIFLWLSILMYKSILVKKDNKYSIIILWIVMNSFLSLYQTRWIGAYLLNLFLYIIVFIFFIKIPFHKKTVRYILFPILITFLFIKTPQQIYSINDDKGQYFGYATLLFWNMSTIIPVINKDINDENFTKYDKSILIKITNFYDEAVKSTGSDTRYRTLNYNSNSLLYGSTSANGELLKYFHRDIPSYTSFCKYYFLKGIINHPIKFFEKILKELSLFYTPGSRIIATQYNLNNSLHNGWKYSLKWYIPGEEKSNLVKNYKKNLTVVRELKLPTVNFKSLNFFYQSINKTYSYILFLTVLFFVFQAYLLLKKKNINIKIFQIGSLSLFFHLILFTINILIATVSYLTVSRYQEELILFILVSFFLSLIYISSFVYNNIMKFLKNKIN